MTILSDKEIRKLCTPPNFVVINNVPSVQEPGQAPGVMTFKHPTKMETFSYLTEAEILFKIRMTKANSIAGLRDEFLIGAVDYRKLTEEEFASFNPMIKPYVDGQVRAICRELTVDEKFNFFNISDYPIKNLDKDENDNPIIKEKIISYGTSSYGYDVRIANEFKIFTNVNNTVLDPKNFNDKSFVDFVGDVCIIPPNSFVLARTLEYFKMPDNVTGLVLGKSTYARLGVSCLATPIEAGWEGEIVLEFANTTPLPVMLYANEGAAQLLFFEGNVPCEVSYATRGGKYMSQRGIQTAIV